MDKDQYGHTTNLAELRQARDILERWNKEGASIFECWAGQVEDDTQAAMNVIREIGCNDFVKWGAGLTPGDPAALLRSEIDGMLASPMVQHIIAELDPDMGKLRKALKDALVEIGFGDGDDDA
jgi:hypothetical protein